MIYLLGWMRFYISLSQVGGRGPCQILRRPRLRVCEILRDIFLARCVTFSEYRCVRFFRIAVCDIFLNSGVWDSSDSGV